MSSASETIQAPFPHDSEGWRRYWQLQGQPWRTEPEINTARQKELTTLRSEAVDVGGMSAFKGIALTRADIEWLLATHESEGMYGPVLDEDEKQWRRTGIDISGALLTKVDLSNLPLARIRGTSFLQSSTLLPQQVAVANLERADLTGCHLEGAYLPKVNLKRAKLIGAFLERAYLKEAHLTGATCTEAHFEEADLSEAHLEDVSLIRAFLEDASLRDAVLEGTNCSEARLSGADFRGACIEKARFNRTHLEGADFRKAFAQQEFVDFRAAYMEGVNLEEASLAGANFREAHLDGGYFGEAHLQRANLSKTQLAGADFRATHLEDADFKDAHLGGKQLRPAELRRIREWVPNFQSELEPADFREALLSSATRLKNAILGDTQWGFIFVADISWNDANLTVIDWGAIPQIGDEYKARRHNKQKKDRGTRLEEYQAAVRANRQLAVALQNQGINEAATRYSYNAQVLQRTVLLLQKKFGQYMLSLSLDLLVGYGYKPLRSFIVYLVVILSFTIIYHILKMDLSWVDAFIISVVTFGRGLAPGNISPSDSVAFASVFEAFIGLIIEATFIAALTNRFLNK